MVPYLSGGSSGKNLCRESRGKWKTIRSTFRSATGPRGREGGESVDAPWLVTLNVRKREKGGEFPRGITVAERGPFERHDRKMQDVSIPHCGTILRKRGMTKDLSTAAKAEFEPSSSGEKDPRSAVRIEEGRKETQPWDPEQAVLVDDCAEEKKKKGGKFGLSTGGTFALMARSLLAKKRTRKERNESIKCRKERGRPPRRSREGRPANHAAGPHYQEGKKGKTRMFKTRGSAASR